MSPQLHSGSRPLGSSVAGVTSTGEPFDWCFPGQTRAIGLKIRELAGIHERALRSLEMAEREDEPQLHPWDEILRLEGCRPEGWSSGFGRRWPGGRLERLVRQKSVELSAANLQLRRGIEVGKRRIAGVRTEASLLDGKLKSSLRFQARLRAQTRDHYRILEADRQVLSRQLQNEVAQTLLGLQVRLSLLNSTEPGPPPDLEQRIANAQHLVVASVRSIQKFTQRLRVPAAERRARLRGFA